MRVAVVFEYATLNGGEQSMLALFDELVESGRDVEIVALAPPEGLLAEELTDREIELVPLELRDAEEARLPRDKALKRLRKALERADADVVHANSLSMGRLTGALGDAFDVPRVAHLRDIIKLSGAALDDLNRNDALVAVSNATRAFHVEQGLDAEKTGVVYNGVDLELFRPLPARGDLKAELGVDDDAFLIATIGQIGLRKGQDVLAQGAAEIADELPDVHFVLVGERHSSKQESIEFEQDVMRTFAEAGLGSRLHLLGWRDDVETLMTECDLLVHPAHQEPLGRALLEAAASGLPIIATDVGGTGEILSDGESARLIPPANPAALAQAIRELHADHEQRETFAEAARQRVEVLFPISRAARALVEVWSIVLE